MRKKSCCQFFLKIFDKITSFIAQRKSVLIVDDEEHIRKKLGNFLKKKSYVVHTASTVEEAKRKILEEANLNYVTIDLKLGTSPEDYNGIQVYKFVRQNRPDIVPLILSAYLLNKEMEEELKEHLTEGESIREYYISKGGETNYLLAVLDKLIENQKQR